jgi:2-polyprenyl-6-hydroxyphenyl methylase/3-demethylubiquinone-9 3-methyltransferase
MGSSTSEERFSFGHNWEHYLDSALDESRIEIATTDLRELVGIESLAGKSFLDIGSGSGLHSLAAFRLGAQSITSFDYDQNSVHATKRLHRQAGSPPNWQVFQGSILDHALVAAHQADIVYSWGVLHHTGQMWQAIRNASRMVKPGGLFVIAIYNRIDRWRLGGNSATWQRIKRAYVNAHPVGQKLMVWGYKLHFVLYYGLIGRQNPFKLIRERRAQRGMDWHHDAVDWVGGYPFEYASVEEVVAFCERELGLTTLKVVPRSGHACNEFVFQAKV